MCHLLFGITIFRIGKLKLFHLNQSKSFVHTSPNREIIHCDLPNVTMSQVKNNLIISKGLQMLGA